VSTIGARFLEELSCDFSKRYAHLDEARSRKYGENAVDRRGDRLAVVTGTPKNILKKPWFCRMKYQKLLILLPCHGLEDFPTHYEGSEADGLLAGWSALWHPALIAAVERGGDTGDRVEVFEQRSPVGQRDRGGRAGADLDRQRIAGESGDVGVGRVVSGCSDTACGGNTSTKPVSTPTIPATPAKNASTIIPPPPP
jgi:hypothetical protein